MRPLPKRLLLNHPSSVSLFPLMRRVLPYTILGFEPLYQNYEFLKKLEKKGLSGAVVECGCWKGGSSAFMAKVSGRETFAFDSFEGMPEKKEFDHKEFGKRDLAQGDLAVSEKYIKEIRSKLGVEKNLYIVKGWFDATLPKTKKEIGKIAFLRVDGDFYDSTMTVLEELYDQVIPGGYIIFDDYNDFVGCRKAIADFFTSRKLYPAIQQYYPLGKPYLQKPL